MSEQQGDPGTVPGREGEGAPRPDQYNVDTTPDNAAATTGLGGIEDQRQTGQPNPEGTASAPYDLSEGHPGLDDKASPSGT